MTAIWKWLTFPFRLVRGTAKWLITLFFLASLTLNIAMVTMNGVYAAVSGAVSAVGVTTVAAREAAQRVATRKAARTTAQRVTRRTMVRSTRNVTSSFGEAVPVLGVAVIAGALALEAKDACDTLEDMAALTAVVEGDDDPDLAERAARDAFDCRDALGEAIDVPSGSEIWAGVLASPGKIWAGAEELYDDLPSFSISAIASGVGDIFGGSDGQETGATNE